MWIANEDKQNSRRMVGALLCAALLHITLFFVIDRYSHLPDAALSSDRSKVTRIQLALPQAQQEPKLQIVNEIESNRSQPKDQIERNVSSGEPASKETKQKSAEPVVKTLNEPAPLPTDKQNEAATEAEPQQIQTAHRTDETGTGDARSSSPAEASSNDSEINMEAARKAMEQPFHRRVTEDSPQASQQEFTVYLQQLIEKKRRYPRAARRRNIEGSVEFSVHVSREGSLAELTLNSSSGSRILDKAAEDLLEKVFPVDYPLQENVRTTIRIIYKLTEV